MLGTAGIRIFLGNFARRRDAPLESLNYADIIHWLKEACWGSPKFTAEVLQQAERLKFIGHAAGTVIPIVNEDVFETSITVTNANKLLAQSTAELTVALMAAGAWRLHPYAKGMQEGIWSKNDRETVLGIGGRTIGLIGFGEISRHVIRMLAGFQVRILLNSRYCPPQDAKELGAELCELDELLSQSDIVSLHNTWTPETEGMIGARELGLMKDGALFVNTARSAIVQEHTLLKELQSGRISAALDVFMREPLDRNDPLLQLPNVLCVPHIGGYHGRLKENMGRFIIGDLKRLMEGGAPEGKITRDMYRRLTPR